MWTSLGEVLPLAVALAVSPFAVVTGVVLLLGDGGRLKAALFGLGWFAAILVVASAAYWLVDAAYDSDPAHTDDGVDIVQLALGVLFFGLAALSWRKRPADGERPREAKMLDRLTGMSSLGALGLGVGQGVLVIKNVPLALGAGATIGESGVRGADAVVLLVLFAVIATAGVVVPLAVSIVGGAKVSSGLVELRRWLEVNLTAVTVAILVVLGALFVGNGLSILD